MIIRTHEEKAFEKIEHPFMVKRYYQSGNRGNIS